MSIQIRSVLKNWFKNGKKPTETQFSDWIDSFYHKTEDALAAVKSDWSNISGIATGLNNYSVNISGITGDIPETQVISVYFDAANTGPSTLSVNGKPPSIVVTGDGKILPSGFIKSGSLVLFVRRGLWWQVLGDFGGSGSATIPSGTAHTPNSYTCIIDSDVSGASLFLVKFTETNTGSPELSINGTNKLLITLDGSSLPSGFIVAGGIYLITPHGANYQIIGGGGGSISSTDEVTEGTTNKYWTNARTITSTLNGYVKAGASAALTASHTILQALSILEKKVDDKVNKAGDTMTGNLITPARQLQNSNVSAQALITESPVRVQDCRFEYIPDFQQLNYCITDPSSLVVDPTTHYLIGKGFDGEYLFVKRFINNNNRRIIYIPLDPGVNINSFASINAVTSYNTMHKYLLGGRDTSNNAVIMSPDSTGGNLTVKFTRANSTITSMAVSGNTLVACGRDDDGTLYIAYSTTSTITVFTVEFPISISENLSEIKGIYLRTSSEWHIIGQDLSNSTQARYIFTSNSGITWNVSAALIPDFEAQSIVTGHLSANVIIGGYDIVNNCGVCMYSPNSGVSWNISIGSEGLSSEPFYLKRPNIGVNSMIFAFANGVVLGSKDSGMSWAYNASIASYEIFIDIYDSNSVIIPGNGGAGLPQNYDIGVTIVTFTSSIKLGDGTTSLSSKGMISGLNAISFNADPTLAVSLATLKESLSPNAIKLNEGIAPSDRSIATDLPACGFTASSDNSVVSWDTSYIDVSNINYEHTIVFTKENSGSQEHQFFSGGYCYVKTDNQNSTAGTYSFELTGDPGSVYVIVLKRIGNILLIVVSKFN